LLRLHKQLTDLASQVERSTRRLSWKSSLGWALGIAMAIPLTISVGVRHSRRTVEKLSVEGLTPNQTRTGTVAGRAVPHNKNDWPRWHVCNRPSMILHVKRREPAVKP